LLQLKNILIAENEQQMALQNERESRLIKAADQSKIYKKDFDLA
jgi:hypothetical protein